MTEQAKGFAALTVTLKTGDEPLHDNARPLGPTLLDFWRWSTSDLVSNATRGKLAEFITAMALGVADGIRAEWDPFDLRTPDGVKTVDPLDVSQWEFYIVRAAVLDERFPKQKSISLASLLTLKPCVAKYQDIAACVENLPFRPEA